VQDPAASARGRYIVYGPGRCADCHAADAARPQLLLGEDVPLTGGSGETTSLGTWRAPNLTPDPATGVGHVGPTLQPLRGEVAGRDAARLSR
jgi:hypothetical protein